jgi:hypothetical protein
MKSQEQHGGAAPTPAAATTTSSSSGRSGWLSKTGKTGSVSADARLPKNGGWEEVAGVGWAPIWEGKGAAKQRPKDS